MTEDDDGAPQTKFTAMSEMSKELLSKGVEVTKSSSKKALEFSKKITQEGIDQAKEGLSTLSEKKDEYLAKRDAKKLEQSISEFHDNTESSSKPKIMERFKSKKKKVEGSELDLIKEQMKQIEHEFPTVLSEKESGFVAAQEAQTMGQLHSMLAAHFSIVDDTRSHTACRISGTRFRATEFHTRIHFAQLAVKFHCLRRIWRVANAPWGIDHNPADRLFNIGSLQLEFANKDLGDLLWWNLVLWPTSAYFLQ